MAISDICQSFFAVCTERLVAVNRFKVTFSGKYAILVQNLILRMEFNF